MSGPFPLVSVFTSTATLTGGNSLAGVVEVGVGVGEGVVSQLLTSMLNTWLAGSKMLDATVDQFWGL